MFLFVGQQDPKKDSSECSKSQVSQIPKARIRQQIHRIIISTTWCHVEDIQPCCIVPRHSKLIRGFRLASEELNPI